MTGGIHPAAPRAVRWHRPFWRAALPSWPAVAARLSRAGYACLLLLVLVQVRATWDDLRESAPPASQTAAFAEALRTRPDLAGAVVLADPDYLVEPLPYHLANPTYLTRQQRFGRVVQFTRHARLDLALDDILATARRLAATRGQPAIVLLSLDLAGVTGPIRRREGYDWSLTADPGQVARFRAGAALFGRFRPARTDEAFDAWVVAPPGPGGRVPA